MPIKWSAVQVAEAMDRVEEQVNQAIEPLQKAKTIAEEAKKIPKLPQYIEQGINGVIGVLDDATGGSHSWSGNVYPSRFIARIQSVRNSIPQEALEAERNRGKTLALNL